MLRRFATTTKHQGVNLRVELQKYDSNRIGRLDQKQFSRCMKQLAIALTDDEIKLLSEAGELPEFRGFVDIKHFITKVQQAQKAKPLPSFLSRPQSTTQNKSIMGKS